ncbi:MAG: hypothetical protein AB7P07_02485 [Hyphomonadaceae bacterium]
MQSAVRLPIDVPGILAFMAQMRLWLAEALAWTGSSAWLREELAIAAINVRQLLFLRAVARVTLTPRAMPARRPHQPHVARTQRAQLRALIGPALRGLCRGAYAARLARIRAILDDPEPVVARIVNRLVRLAGRMRALRIIPTLAPRVVGAVRAAHAGAFATDTS